MLRTVGTLLSIVALTLAVAAPAAAHNLVVTNPRTGDVVNERWVGGDTVPEPAQEADPMFGPFSLPPSHGAGLVDACEGTSASPAVSILAPPSFTGCQHGE